MPSLLGLSTLTSSALLILAIVIALAALYLLRPLSHKLISNVTRLLYALLRQGSRLLRRAGDGLWQQSRELVQAQVHQQLARSSTQNFTRIGQFVERGLGGYPALEHRITLQVSRLEEDYQDSTLMPPPPPDWADTVESVVNLQLKSSHQPLVEKILEDMRLMAEDQQRENLRHYRQSMNERHGLLKRMLPAWRRLSGRIDRLSGQLREITQRAHQIDTQMTRLEHLEQSGQTLDMRTKLSRLGYFVVAAGALTLLSLAAWVNYQLLAAPLQMALASSPGAETALGSFSAGLWLSLQLLLGLMILELLQVTRLLPALGQLSPRVRHTGLGLCLALLLTLAALGTLLVWNSGLWAVADNLDAAERDSTFLALILSSCLAFILPLLLALSAIPLEQCIDNLRPLGGYTLGALLLACAAILHLLGLLAKRSGPLLILFYDIIISVPLLLERRWQQGLDNKREAAKEKAKESCQVPEPTDRVSRQRAKAQEAVTPTPARKA